MQSDIEKHISNWIQQISIKRSELDGFPVCPFAKKATYEVIEVTDPNIVPPDHAFELIIYVLSDRYSTNELSNLADVHNKKNPDLIFLPDSKSRRTEINGVQTNNGKYNLLLCQHRHALQTGRNTLLRTTYYSFWNKEYLEEILKQ